MGLFLCDLCDQELEENHVCDKAFILKRIKELRNAAQVAEDRLGQVQNAIFMIMAKDLAFTHLGICTKVSVEADWLKELWDASQCRWGEAKTVNDFLSTWIALHDILCEAYDVFRTEKYGHPQTLLQKLTDLRNVCDRSKKVLDYESCVFDMTPEDLTREGK